MNRAAFLFAVLSVCGVGAQAADREFSDVVRAISDECHASPTSTASSMSALQPASHTPTLSIRNRAPEPDGSRARRITSATIAVTTTR